MNQWGAKAWARCCICLTLLYPTPSSCYGQDGPGSIPAVFAEAAQQIRKLPPRAFSELPAAVKQQLEARQCLIPQAEYEARGKNNVLHGSFFARNSSDWAILCAHSGFSSVLVFGQGRETRPADFASEPDNKYLQAAGGNKISYSRQIRVFRPKDFKDYQRQGLADPRSPPIQHDAIDLGFNGKAAEIYYFRNHQFLVIGAED